MQSSAYGDTKNVYDAIECSLFFLIESRNEYTKQRKKKERTCQSSATQGFSIYAYVFSNLEQLFELAVVVLNGILLPFTKQCVLFFSFLSVFFFYLTLTSITYTFSAFFSHVICCSNTHLWRNNPERTLNCNDGERDIVYIHTYIYIYIYIYNKRTRVKKKKKKNGLHFSSRISAKTEEWSLL
jgi:hypothetical protein